MSQPETSPSVAAPKRYGKTIVLGILFAVVIAYPLGVVIGLANSYSEKVLTTASSLDGRLPGGPRSLVLQYVKRSERFAAATAQDSGVTLLGTPLQIRAEGIRLSDPRLQANAEEVVGILVERGHSVDARNEGLTLLQAAALVADADQVSYLLKLGADPTLVGDTEIWTNGLTAVQMAYKAQTVTPGADFSKVISAIKAEE